MIFLRYLLLFYSLVGIFIAGGLFFKKSNRANIFLALFLILFSLEQLDFLYVTGSLLENYPPFFMVLFPICLLFGPSLWFYVSAFDGKRTYSFRQVFLHSIPFFTFLLFTIYLLSYSGPERIQYVTDHFFSQIMPLNYIKALHVSIYGVLMLQFIRKRKREWSAGNKHYLLTLVAIYVITAVLQAFLTIFAVKYNYFVIYFLAVSTLVLFVGYALYFQPEWLRQLQKKYFNSSLMLNDRERIRKKITQYFFQTENIANSRINLTLFCEHIDEKKHHVSQTLSEEFQTTFNDLVNQHRIQYAKKLLTDPEKQELKILAVALESGFSNKTTFYRAFEKFSKCTPNEFRQKRGNI